MIFRYLKIWWMATIMSSQIAFLSRFGAFVFTIGKFLRFLFFLFFLYLIASKTKAVGEYSLWQVVFFYATFNFIDTLTQLLLREVYRFRSYVVRGYFDYILTKPISPLFRSLFGGSDILDLPMLLLSIFLLFISVGNIGIFSLEKIFLYIFLVFNAFFIALAFHIAVLAIGVLTTEVDNAIMLYRDLTMMGRFPVDIYKEPIRGIFTFIIPIGIMMTFPPKALMGILSPNFILLAIIIGSLLFISSIYLWKISLKYYSSSSS